MNTVEIFTTPTCGYCAHAKKLLAKKAVKYHEVNLFQEPERRDEMIRRSGGRMTVPQIFIDGKSIGGCDDLYALERAGKLDNLLGTL